MRIYLDCFPCFLRQALDAARFATEDKEVHKRVIQDVLRLAIQTDMHNPPPVIGQQVHRLIRQITGKEDPYAEQKRRSNELALRLCSEMPLTHTDRRVAPIPEDVCKRHFLGR